MTDQPQPAAERECLRAFAEIATGIGGHKAMSVAEAMIVSKRLAEAWLAEHPADDDEPITSEWLESVGLENDGPDNYWHMDSDLSLFHCCGEWDVFVDADSGEAVRVCGIKTRGEWRRLVQLAE